MFTEMQVRNFKSWQDTGPIRLAPVTAFFGPNSSGKTSLLQALLLLKQSVESVDRRQVLNLGDDRSLVSLGLMTEVIYNHDPDSRLEFALSWNDDNLTEDLSETVEGITLDHSVEYSFSTNVQLDRRSRPYVHDLAYRADGIDIEYGRRGTHGGYRLTAKVHGQDYLKRHRGRPSVLPPPRRYYGFPDESFAQFQNADFLSLFEFSLLRLFDGLYYLGPLRERPIREYRWQGSRPSGVGVSGERTIEALLASDARPRKEGIARRLRRNGYPVKRLPVKQVVQEWLKEMDLVDTFNVEQITPEADLYRVAIQRTSDSATVLLPDVGFGVSQVLPVLALLASVPERSVVILEQPELHLHPAVQASLSDVILETARVNRAQVIIESHSEHLLRRLQRRVAENTDQADDLALYFCHNEDGQSMLEHLELNVLGEISNWPLFFFGDSLGESVAMVRARARRASS